MSAARHTHASLCRWTQAGLGRALPARDDDGDEERLAPRGSTRDDARPLPGATADATDTSSGETTRPKKDSRVSKGAREGRKGEKKPDATREDEAGKKGAKAGAARSVAIRHAERRAILAALR